MVCGHRVVEYGKHVCTLEEVLLYMVVDEEMVMLKLRGCGEVSYWLARVIWWVDAFS